MAKVARLVATVSASVNYPTARWQVMLAIASLSDREYQERVWVRQEVPTEDYYDSLDLAVNTLFDDWIVLPNPQEAIGAILIDGPEIEKIRAVGELLGPLIAELKDRPDEDYLNDSRWPLVVERSHAALSAMVLAGPIEMGQA